MPWHYLCLILALIYGKNKFIISKAMMWLWSIINKESIVRVFTGA